MQIVNQILLESFIVMSKLISKNISYSQLITSLPLSGRPEQGKKCSLPSGLNSFLVSGRYISFEVINFCLQVKIENLPSGSEFKVNVYAGNEN